MKYNRAFDKELNRYVGIEEFTEENKAEWYDRPRYFKTDDIDSEENEVLGYVRQSQPFRRSNMREDTPDIVRAAHFVKVCNNTKYECDRLSGKVKTQESYVHKLTKEIGKAVKVIKIPAIVVNVAGYEIRLTEEQYIPVQFIDTEYSIRCCNAVADIAYDTEILGVKQKIFVEVLYRHRVDEEKRNRLQTNKINCIEVDISDIREELDLSYQEIKRELLERITYTGYWISSAIKEIVEHSLADTELIEMTIHNGKLRHSEYRDGAYFSRAYAFKDMLKLPKGHKCHIEKEETWGANPDKYTNVGECNNCKTCASISGYLDSNVNNIRVVCMANTELENVAIEELVETVRNNLIAKYRKMCE